MQPWIALLYMNGNIKSGAKNNFARQANLRTETFCLSVITMDSVQFLSLRKSERKREKHWTREGTDCDNTWKIVTGKEKDEN